MRFKGIFMFLLSSIVTIYSIVGWTGTELKAYAKSKDVRHEFELDSDGDGLKDIYEFFITDPTKTDTDEDGIFDPDEDFDDDGLTNIEEQSLGTKLDDIDSDGDGLTDKDEVEKYDTKPEIADTDGDQLNDGTEILYLESDPQNSDENENNKRDGEETHSFDFPKNDFKIRGEMKGKSNVIQRVSVRETSTILIDQIDSKNSFDIISLDPEIEFELSIPYEQNSKKEDYTLFKYDKKQANLVLVDKQKLNKKSNTIEAEFSGGGTFIILSKEDWTNTFPQEKAKKNKFTKFKGSAKLKGLPHFELNGDGINEDGTFKVSKKVKFKHDDSLDGNDTDIEDEVTLEATYRINEVYEGDEEPIVTASAVTIESGKQPVILIHGLLGGGDTWGFEDRWYHNTYDEPWAAEKINGYETLTGEDYYFQEETSYTNIDVHSITGITDDDELGPVLITEYGYTPNEDLFIYLYNADGLTGCVREAANNLKDVINDLQSQVFHDTSQDVSLVGHSMGGLVARYLVENVSSVDVDRIITLGTPHFGSDKSTFGDLDRDDSELWNGSNKLENDTSKPIIGIGGWAPSYNTLVGDWGDLRGTYGTALGVGGATDTHSSWNEYVNEKYYDKTGFYPYYGDIEDGWVNIDSALGSDYDPEEGNLEDPVQMNYRIMIWDDEYGDHSLMRKHPRTPYYVDRALSGSYDDNNKD